MKNEGTYLVFKIFKNCKISENWISLKALRNLKPASTKHNRGQKSIRPGNNNTVSLLYILKYNRIKTGINSKTVSDTLYKHRTYPVCQNFKFP